MKGVVEYRRVVAPILERRRCLMEFVVMGSLSREMTCRKCNQNQGCGGTEIQRVGAAQNGGYVPSRFARFESRTRKRLVADRMGRLLSNIA